MFHRRYILTTIAFGAMLGSTHLASAAGPYLFELLDRPNYRAAWDKMLRFDKADVPWLEEFSRSYNGVAFPSEEVWIGGIEYRYASVCKPHDCAGNELHVLFSPDAVQAWGLLVSGGNEKRWLGDPDEYVQAAILKQAGQ